MVLGAGMHRQRRQAGNEGPLGAPHEYLNTVFHSTLGPPSGAHRNPVGKRAVASGLLGHELSAESFKLGRSAFLEAEARKLGFLGGNSL